MPPTVTPAPAAQPLDHDALHARYAAERARRLRADGNQQYREISGTLAHYAQDPWAPPPTARAAVQRRVRLLVIGGGFGGLLAAARALDAGAVAPDDLCLVETAADVGGTWYWNRYPGAACDTESYIYLPLLEETGYLPRAKYAFAPEILGHAQRIARHWGLYERALFQTRVSALDWDEAQGHWIARTDRDDRIEARFVVLAGGLLNRPKLPGIPGLERFAGKSFHTSRWDYAYTGGSPGDAMAGRIGGLVGLAGQRVGLIGTGATAVQCVPHLGASAGELFVFQRTPSSVDVRNNRPTDPAWAAGLQPGWQRERMLNFTAVISGGRFEVDLVNDGWTDLIGNILLAARRGQAAGGAPLSAEATQALIQQADDHKMERVRARVAAVVKDPVTAEALKPWYSQFCKRPCFHDEYLDTFNRPNVHLVDTHGRGVECITERGVVVDGREHPLDCLVFGTGFEVGTDYTRRLGFEVTGVDGLTLGSRWAQGCRSLHGLFSVGFPNLFIVSTHQSGQSANFQHMLDEQARHIAHILATARQRGIARLEATPEAEDAWVAEVVRHAHARQDYLAACTPGYYNNEGQIDERHARNSQYWRGPTAFIRLLQAWRDAGTLPGLDCRAEALAAPPRAV